MLAQYAVQTATVRAPAKINLDLRVGHMGEDGYHPLSTVYHAVDLFDEITVTRAHTTSIEARGPYKDKIPLDHNLVYDALAKVRSEFPNREQFTFTIDKSIPIAGGMAGGSADAAAALVALGIVQELNFSGEQLELFGGEMGSDIPFAFTGGTALGSGHGEQVMPILARGSYEWVFALHHEGLSTPRVYREWDRLNEGRAIPDPQPNQDMMAALRTGDLAQLIPHLHNDLQPAAISLMPKLEDTIEAGLDAGALAGFVSGSGPTIAFLCDSRASALDLMVELSAGNVADQLVRAAGPAPGTHVVRGPSKH